jgi:hypothetical protein
MARLRFKNVRGYRCDQVLDEKVTLKTQSLNFSNVIPSTQLRCPAPMLVFHETL